MKWWVDRRAGGYLMLHQYCDTHSSENKMPYTVLRVRVLAARDMRPQVSVSDAAMAADCRR
jgi:hypothetical protein